MSRSKSHRFTVEVGASGNREECISRDTQVTVLDGQDRVLGRGHGRVELALEPGLYTIRLDRAGLRSEQFCRHDRPTDVHLSEPKRYSAVPTSDTSTSREYYRMAAYQWSRSPTSDTVTHADSSLFVFLRAPSEGRANADSERAGLRVVGYDGDELLRLGPANTVQDIQQGWIAFHAPFAAGHYILSYDPPSDVAAPAREMALAVFPGWQTQVYMTITDVPLFASASVLLSQDGFDPDDRVDQAVDAGLAGLQNPTSTLDSETLDMLLYGKFSNPMLGLVGAHALLRGEKVATSRIEMIFANLRRLLGDAPDVRALELIAHRRHGLPFDPSPFQYPPLLREGLEAVYEASATIPAIVPAGGVLQRIATERFADSPWSTWRPRLRTSPGDDPLAPRWVTNLIEDAVVRAAERGTSLDVSAIAAQARLPASSIAIAYDAVRDAMPPSRARTIEMTRLVADSRRAAGDSPLTRDGARERFLYGTDGERIEVLGTMHGNTALRDFEVVLDGIRNSRSAFEQYHALRLAQGMIDDFDDAQRALLATTITRSRGERTWMEPGTDRWYLSGQILDTLGGLPTAASDVRAAESPDALEDDPVRLHCVNVRA